MGFDAWAMGERRGASARQGTVVMRGKDRQRGVRAAIIGRFMVVSGGLLIRYLRLSLLHLWGARGARSATLFNIM